MVLFFFAKMPNFTFVQLNGLSIIYSKHSTFGVNVNSSIIATLSVDSVNSLGWLWKEVVLENIRSRVPRHTPFSRRWDLKPRAEGFFASAS